MKIIEKLLDALNLEKMEQRRIAKAKNSAQPNDMELLLKIKAFWETHEYSYCSPESRQANRGEIYEYALTYALSCFAKPRHSNEMSPFHLGSIGITNWPAFFSDISQNGYIRPAAAEEVLSTYTVKELKIIADSLGIKKSGKKMDLIDEIQIFATDDMIDNITSDSDLYILADKGAEYISSREDYVLLEKHAVCDISLSEFNDHRIICGRRRNFYDTMFQALSDKAFKLNLCHCFDKLAITEMHIYNILIEEATLTEHTPHIDVAIRHYLEYLYLLLCFSRDASFLTNEGVFYRDASGIRLPHINNNLIDFKDYFKYINYNVIFSNKPPCFLTDHEFITMVEEFLNTPIFDYDKWNLILQNRFSEYIKLFTKRMWRL